MINLFFIDSLAKLEQHAQDWDDVAGKHPFRSWAWQGSWLKHLGQGLSPAVLVAIDEDGMWKGIAPFCVDQASAFTRSLRFIGSGPACTDYVDLICDDSFYREFAIAVTDWINANIGHSSMIGDIEIIELEGIASGDPQTQFLIDLFTANGFKQHDSELEGGWEVQLPATWEELNASLSKSMRRKTKKAVARLAAETTKLTSTKQEDFEEHWQVFRELHQKRRAMLGQEGCFADPDFEAFVKSAAEKLVEREMAEIVVVESDGKPLASMLLLNSDDSVLMYQAGLDVDRLKLEPGYQIAACSIMRSIEQGMKTFDFLRGDEPYKARWKTQRIPMARTKLIPRKTMARLKHGIWAGVRDLKNLIQSNPSQRFEKD